MSAPVPGTLLAGKYRVEGVLGTGGMGVVVAAHHEQLDQKVAIKLLLPEAAAHPDIVERFAREARAAAKIQGAHVARVIDVGALEDGTPYIVMEYLEGRDLAQELRAVMRLAPSDVAHWILEASEAIAQAHAAKIVHRDLKPSNLFLAKQPNKRVTVKVLDFGISKSIEPGAPALTQTANLIGTAYYMSPEQLTAAKSVDTRADIWALGVIMYELLAGVPPFDGDTMAEIIALILQNEPRPLATLRPDLPPGFADVVAQCMRSKPAARYQNVAELAAALAPFGTKGDEGSAESIARVLGVDESSLAPKTTMAAGSFVAGSSETASPLAQTLALEPSVSGVSGVPGASTGVREAAPATADSARGMAASIAGTPAPLAAPARRSPLAFSLPLAMGLLLGVVVAGGVGAYAVLGGKAPSERRGSATVSAEPASAASAVASVSSPTVILSAAASPEPAPSASASAAGMSAGPSGSAVTGTSLASARVPPGNRTPPRASASASAGAATTTTAAATTASVATTASAPKNGLRMDLK